MFPCAVVQHVSALLGSGRVSMRWESQLFAFNVTCMWRRVRARETLTRAYVNDLGLHMRAQTYTNSAGNGKYTGALPFGKGGGDHLFDVLGRHGTICLYIYENM